MQPICFFLLTYYNRDNFFVGILFRIGIAYKLEDGTLGYVPEWEGISQGNFMRSYRKKLF